MSIKDQSKQSGICPEDLSAWIDGEHDFGGNNMQNLLADKELCRKLDRFQLISCVLSSGMLADTRDRASEANAAKSYATPTAPTRSGWSGQQYFARAAVWLLLPAIAVFFWLQQAALNEPQYDDINIATRSTQQNVLSSPDGQATTRTLADVAVANSGDTETVQALSDFRAAYLVYHSAYLASNNDNNAVLPYVRLANYQQ